MKLVYLANASLYDDWGHNVQIMKMCEAFSQNKIEVTLIVPKRKSLNRPDPYNMYGVSNVFKIVQLPYIDLFQGTASRFLYWVRLLSFLIFARIYLVFSKYDILYTREIFAGPFFKRVYIELHLFPNNIKKIHKTIFENVDGLVVLTSFIKSRLVDLGVNANKIFVSPDAVRLEDFVGVTSVESSREKVGFSKSDFFFGYLGTLKTMGMEKGISTAIDCLEYLPEKYKLYIAGGETEDIDYYKKYSKDKNKESRVIFAGKVSIKERPIHVGVCDIMVAPFPENEHYSYYMSPLKIFEYMASKRPMVVTDLPTLKEILTHEETALFIPPSDPKALAKAIVRLAEDKSLSNRLSTNAYNKVVRDFTWRKRAENILKFVKA